MYGGIIHILENLKVKNIITSKQKQNNEYLDRVLEIAQDKMINVIVVKAGDKIKLDSKTYFDILWPDSNLIQENSTNNNSIVANIIFNDFKMLFTGDIEQISENKIVQKYQGTNKLKSSILKIAHHGSKTSTTQEFLNSVKPKIALIGVGINNKFDHPNLEVLERLYKCDSRIYRTDQNGEVKIIVNERGIIKIKKTYRLKVMYKNTNSTNNKKK